MGHPTEQTFARAFRALRPRAPLPEFVVRFRPYADVNHVIRVREGRVEVGMSDLLEAAPPTVVE
ncbi:MAG TPA: M48 family peptidase, partial [Terriglobia bacterium]|nr:M48 family peptidase [Terriglobia bacterium]